MITRILSGLQTALRYVKDHPQIFFILILLIVFPVLFLYTGQQFLEVGRQNQETLQQQRLGLMHDVLSSMLTVSNFDVLSMQGELQKLAEINPDIIDYKVLKAQGGEFVPIIAMNPEVLGVPETDIDLYRNASIRNDESIIFEFIHNGDRIWNAYRSIESESGEMYFIFTQFSLASVDDLFASRERSAYFSLVFVYFFIIALAVWHIRLTDYRYLYMAAQKTNQTKDLFTNMIAHELRAPLTAIRGYASMLEQELQNPEQKKYASRVQESAERLIAIVNDLLDVARIQSGKLSIEKGEFDLVPVVEAVVDELRVSATEKDIKLELQVSSTNQLVIADKKRLHQALTNLVSNSIKYTQQGSITLSLEDKPAFVELRVKDTGMGISSEDQKKLFAPFFRVKNEAVDSVTGTGLGMWITKELLELMEGTIAVESIKGVGTHIVVTLPKHHSQ